MAPKIKFKTLRSNVMTHTEIIKNESGYFTLASFDTKTGLQKESILIDKKDAEIILDFINENN